MTPREMRDRGVTFLAGLLGSTAIDVDVPRDGYPRRYTLRQVVDWIMDDAYAQGAIETTPWGTVRINRYNIQTPSCEENTKAMRIYFRIRAGGKCVTKALPWHSIARIIFQAAGNSIAHETVILEANAIPEATLEAVGARSF